ncbi:MAG: hypothetical protein ACXWTK_03545 [Methylobacter sp.]
METFQQLKQNIGHAWEHLAEGWENLTHKAASAITRFATGDSSSKLSPEQSSDLTRRNVGWELWRRRCLMMVTRLSLPWKRRAWILQN